MDQAHVLAGLTGRRAHLPVGPGPADPGWGQQQRWGLVGATPSVSSYDVELGPSEDSGIWRAVAAGIFSRRQRLPLSAPTMTRSARISAQLNSLPASRFFQSYTEAGTGRSWSPGVVASTKRAMNMNANPGAIGAAELHPATSYQPFPSPADLYPKVV